MARAISGSADLNPNATRVMSLILVLVDSMSALDCFTERTAESGPQTADVGGLNNDDLVGLSRCFSNPRKVVGSLISRVRKGSRPRRPRSKATERVDQRGPVVEKSRQSQSRAVSCRSSSPMETSAMSAPASAKARAVARPMPTPAPGPNTHRACAAPPCGSVSSSARRAAHAPLHGKAHCRVDGDW